MIVVDNSVATKWIFPEADSNLALTLLADHVSREERVLAPGFLPMEFTNVLLQRMRRDAVSLEDAEAMFDRLFKLPIELFAVTADAQRSLSRRAVVVAAQYGMSATYDAHYVALAEMFDCILWTADRRLVQQLHGRMVRVRALEAYQPAG